MPLTLPEVMAELKSLGSEQTRRTLANHGLPASAYGVKIGDMKPILKRAKKDHALALQLWETGISDARYLAGLMADEKRFDEATAERWVQSADWAMLAEFAVPWITAEAGLGWKCGLRWIEDPRETVASSGWMSLSCHVSGTTDEKLDLDAIRGLIARVVKEIHGERNRVRYTMNGFVIAVGSYVAPLSAEAVAAANAIGKVRVDMGDTECKVPFAPEYIAKAAARGPVKKRKTHRC